jgi:hypothetical protein
MRTFQITFKDGNAAADGKGQSQTWFPVYRKGCSLSGVQPGVEEW